MRDEQLLKRIIDYLGGWMSGSDRTDFEKQMKKDPDLTATVQIQRSIDQALRDHGPANFRKTLEERSLRRRRIRRMNRNLAFAGSIILLLVLAYLFLQPDTPTPEEAETQVFAMVEQADSYQPLNSGIKGQSDSIGVWVKNGEAAYNKDQFEEATTWMSKALNAQPENDQLRFYYATALRLADNNEQAVTQLESLLKQEARHTYGLSARWELALTFCQMDRYREAVLLLEELQQHPDVDSELRKKAKTLQQAAEVLGEED
jgi:tetratricopeptide (TPR) repeat protein